MGKGPTRSINWRLSQANSIGKHAYKSFESQKWNHESENSIDSFEALYKMNVPFSYYQVLVSSSNRHNAHDSQLHNSTGDSYLRPTISYTNKEQVEKVLKRIHIKTPQTCHFTLLAFNLHYDYRSRITTKSREIQMGNHKRLPGTNTNKMMSAASTRKVTANTISARLVSSLLT